MARRQPTHTIRPTEDVLGAFIAGEDETIIGTDFNDTLYGSFTNDLIIGGNGDDQLIGGDGDDELEGGLGKDTLWGEGGRNNLYGGDGDDQLISGEGGNLWGGNGNDTLWANSGGFLLYGEDGNDQLIGDNGGERLEGGNGNDTLWGEAGDDKLFGGGDNDQLLGSSGNDSLYGGDGNNYLDGFGGGFQEIDFISGGKNSSSNAQGTNTFVIGDSSGVYYQGGGSEDTEDLSYAVIQYFSTGSDDIQAFGSASDYDLVFDEFSGNGIQDTGIYLGDDLIAVVDDTTNVIIEQDFIFV